MAAQLLAGGFCHQLHKLRGKKAVRILCPDMLQRPIGVQSRIVVAGAILLRRSKGKSLPGILPKLEAHRRPGGVNAVFFEQGKELRNCPAPAQDMLPVVIQGAHIQHSPKQFKIQRYNQRTWHERHLLAFQRITLS